MKYRLVSFFTEAASYLLAFVFRWRKRKGAVLHISYGVHIAYYTVKILRENNINADYLAIGKPNDWSKRADYTYEHHGSLAAKRLREFIFFWKHISKYPVVHAHFMIILSETGWELKFMKMMGNKLVAHFRGCEIRNKEKNIRLHPEVNICQQCDYNARICTDPVNRLRVSLAEKYADHIIVTTPDMKDFLPAAEHVPFFTPPVEFKPAIGSEPKTNAFRIVHVTNHPGIEGTEEIRQVIEELRHEGYNIDFVFLKGQHNDVVLAELGTADLTIGKMKMGYYANAQIESMYVGVPAITWIRPEFVTEELLSSGLIITNLSDLKQTLKEYITNPEKLEAKRKISRSSALKLHDNARLSARYKEIYLSLFNT